jgi:hypothetical protein
MDTIIGGDRSIDTSVGTPHHMTLHVPHVRKDERGEYIAAMELAKNTQCHCRKWAPPDTSSYIFKYTADDAIIALSRANATDVAAALYDELVKSSSDILWGSPSIGLVRDAVENARNENFDAAAKLLVRLEKKLCN